MELDNRRYESRIGEQVFDSCACFGIGEGEMVNPDRRQFLNQIRGITALALSPFGVLEVLAEEPKREYIFEDYIGAVIQIESGGNPRALRHEPKLDDYSCGLGQLLTRTAKDIEIRHPELPRIGGSKEDIKNSLFNPEINRAYIGVLFREELNFYKDPYVAVAAYNSGHLTPRNARCQEQLNDIFSVQLNTDGIIGEKSKKTVKQFQRQYDLTDDGIIGPKTYSKLQEVWTSANSGAENPRGVIPKNNYTPNHVRKFREALRKN